jgi:Fe-S-cluster containining protein
MADDVWYADGLRFECTRCGACCTGAPGYVWVDDAEITALAKFRGDPVRQFVPLYTRPARGKRTLKEKANGDCVFWEAGRGCTVYPVRPKQCRTWPFWASNVETPEAWERTTQICPGSGRGDLIPVEEITRRVKAIKM